MYIRRMRIACWAPKATNTHSEYITLIPFPPATVVAPSRTNVPLHVHFPSYSMLKLVVPQITSSLITADRVGRIQGKCTHVLSRKVVFSSINQLDISADFKSCFSLVTHVLTWRLSCKVHVKSVTHCYIQTLRMVWNVLESYDDITAYDGPRCLYYCLPCIGVFVMSERTPHACANDR